MKEKNKSQPKRPEPPGWLVELVIVASQKAQRGFLLYMGFLVYCLLSIISISDRQLGLSSTINLPLLNANVPLVGFFVAAPLLAVLSFVYVQIFILRAKNLTAYLDTQYSPREERHFLPWTMKSVQVPGAKMPDKLLNTITGFLLWTSLPVSLILIAFRFMKRHDPVWSYVVGAIPILGTLILLWFWRRVKSSAQRKSVMRTIFRLAVVFPLIAAELFLLFYLIPWANAGLSPGVLKNVRDRIRPLFCVDLSYQKLVEEPVFEYESHFWGRFQNVHLEGAILTHAILRRADFEGACLRDARMDFAILIEANLRYARMRGAFFCYTDFRSADLGEVNLVSCYGRNARFQGAKFRNADMRGARIIYSDFQGADFSLADLSGASLWGSNFRSARLFHTNLQEANLSRADFSEADLKGVILRGADLWCANLQGVKNLNAEQLSEAKTLYQAKLDPELRKEMLEKYPHLLEKISCR